MQLQQVAQGSSSSLELAGGAAAGGQQAQLRAVGRPGPPTPVHPAAAILSSMSRPKLEVRRSGLRPRGRATLCDRATRRRRCGCWAGLRFVPRPAPLKRAPGSAVSLLPPTHHLLPPTHPLPPLPYPPSPSLSTWPARASSLSPFFGATRLRLTACPPNARATAAPPPAASARSAAPSLAALPPARLADAHPGHAPRPTVRSRPVQVHVGPRRAAQGDQADRALPVRRRGQCLHRASCSFSWLPPHSSRLLPSPSPPSLPPRDLAPPFLCEEGAAFSLLIATPPG